MIHNAADEELVQEAQKEVKNERDQELEDIKAILDLPAGVRFFKTLFERGKVFQSTFTGNSHTFFLEGHRNLALMFFRDVCEAAPNMVAELMIEKKRSDKDG